MFIDGEKSRVRPSSSRPKRDDDVARILHRTLRHGSGGVRVLYLPPYSHDFNPIELGWGLQKQYVRKHAPRTKADLLRVAKRARHRITQRHCHDWFAHAGYSVQLR